MNYGFIMDNNTGLLVDVAPLFDFNLALIADLTGRKVTDTLSQMFNTNETIEDVARQMLPYSNIQINYEKLKQTKKYFKDYPQAYENILVRIKNCLG